MGFSISIRTQIFAFDFSAQKKIALLETPLKLCLAVNFHKKYHNLLTNSVEIYILGHLCELAVLWQVIECRLAECMKILLC